ncbi:MAG: hypothetical protein MJ252_09120 [archaeon]|nr:hypothetical protein [archaeon]
MERNDNDYEGIRKIKFVAYGSPLIDLIADVSDEFIQKYQITLGETRHEELSKMIFFPEFKQHDITYIPGGCQFNAMRVFNVRIFLNI